jgi:hypothetical protein
MPSLDKILAVGASVEGRPGAPTRNAGVRRRPIGRIIVESGCTSSVAELEDNSAPALLASALPPGRGHIRPSWTACQAPNLSKLQFLSSRPSTRRSSTARRLQRLVRAWICCAPRTSPRRTATARSRKRRCRGSDLCLPSLRLPTSPSLRNSSSTPSRSTAIGAGRARRWSLQFRPDDLSLLSTPASRGELLSLGGPELEWPSLLPGPAG